MLVDQRVKAGPSVTYQEFKCYSPATENFCIREGHDDVPAFSRLLCYQIIGDTVCGGVFSGGLGSRLLEWFTVGALGREAPAERH